MFPHQQILEQRFGVSLDRLIIRIDADACSRRGTVAFTVGRTVTFAEPHPTLRIAAHEAAHALGVRGEALADFIAGEVVARRPVAALLPPAPAADAEARSYTVVTADKQSADNFQVGEDVRVSDDGHMAVSRETRHTFYATETQIDASNDQLRSQKSRIELQKASEKVRGASPTDGSDRELTRVDMTQADQSVDSHNKDGPQQWADCGRSARSIMGEGDPVPRGVHYDGDDEETTEAAYAPKHFAREMRRDAGLEPSDKDAADIYGRIDDDLRTRFFRTAAPEKWNTFSEADKKKILGIDSADDLPDEGRYYDLSGAQRKTFIEHIKKDSYGDMDAWDKDRFKEWVSTIRYYQKSDEEQQQFDQQQGINEYAAPGVGEAYTIIREDDVGGGGYNFHWGGVIMVSGHDRVTLENFSVDDYNVMNDKWFYEMYGPPTKEGQTFHEQYMDQESVGSHGTTMMATTGGAFSRSNESRVSQLMQMTTTGGGIWLVSDPSSARDTIIERLPKGTSVTVTNDHDDKWFEVETADGKVGYVSKRFLI